MQPANVHRRDFLKNTAGGPAAVSLTAATYEPVLVADARAGTGFPAVRGRCQQHVDVVLKRQKEGKGLAPVAVCDVWGGDAALGSGKGRGLFPTAKRCGLKEDDGQHVTKDYRKLLGLKE